jgi:hypothetical protein
MKMSGPHNRSLRVRRPPEKPALYVFFHGYSSGRLADGII